MEKNTGCKWCTYSLNGVRNCKKMETLVENYEYDILEYGRCEKKNSNRDCPDFKPSLWFRLFKPRKYVKYLVQ